MHEVWADPQVFEAFKVMVVYAREKGITRLLLDVISNGGGYVDLSDLIRSLFVKNYDPQSHCMVGCFALCKHIVAQFPREPLALSFKATGLRW